MTTVPDELPVRHVMSKAHRRALAKVPMPPWTEIDDSHRMDLADMTMRKYPHMIQGPYWRIPGSVRLPVTPDEPKYKGHTFGVPAYDRGDWFNDTYLKFVDNPPDNLIEYGQPCGTYVKSVVTNMERTRYRDARNHDRIIRRGMEMPAGNWLSSRNRCESAESAALRNMAERDTRRAIGRLPVKLAAVAELRFDGYTYEEISGALGITADAARKRIAKIRRDYLRHLLQ